MKADAYLITDKTNIQYLSNFTGSNGLILLASRSKYLFTDFRYIERAKNTIKKGIRVIDTTKMWKNMDILKKNWQKILKKHKIKTLGIEEDNMTITYFKNLKKITNSKQKIKVKFINISGKIEKLREQKNNTEIRHTKKSQQINEKTLLAIKNFIQLQNKKNKSFTEFDINWKIKELAYEYGAENMAFDPIVAFGKHTAMPHHKSDNTKFKKGDILLIDMGVVYKGYHSDMTRVFFSAPPTPKQKNIYNLVLKAQKNAINNIKAGITGKTADKFARDIINQSGFKENYGHAGGHGTGLNIHERPSLSENYKDKLKKNSIVTIEPGVYIEGEFGIRIEDMVLLTKTGAKNLTNIPKSQGFILV